MSANYEFCFALNFIKTSAKEEFDISWQTQAPALDPLPFGW